MVNSEPIDKLNTKTLKWCLYWNAYIKALDIVRCVYDANVFFESKEAAQQAIDIVGKDDLVWLFRDFQPYIGAYVKSEEK